MWKNLYTLEPNLLPNLPNLQKLNLQILHTPSKDKDISCVKTKRWTRCDIFVNEVSYMGKKTNKHD